MRFRFGRSRSNEWCRFGPTTATYHYPDRPSERVTVWGFYTPLMYFMVERVREEEDAAA